MRMVFGSRKWREGSQADLCRVQQVGSSMAYACIPSFLNKPDLSLGGLALISKHMQLLHFGLLKAA